MIKKIGALWKKTSKKGNEFLSGNLIIDNKKILIMVFENKEKKEKQPNYIICLSELDETSQKIEYKKQKIEQDPFIL